MSNNLTKRVKVSTKWYYNKWKSSCFSDQFSDRKIELNLLKYFRKLSKNYCSKIVLIINLNFQSNHKGQEQQWQKFEYYYTNVSARLWVLMA